MASAGITFTSRLPHLERTKLNVNEDRFVRETDFLKCQAASPGSSAPLIPWTLAFVHPTLAYGATYVYLDVLGNGTNDVVDYIAAATTYNQFARHDRPHQCRLAQPRRVGAAKRTRELIRLR